MWLQTCIFLVEHMLFVIVNGGQAIKLQKCKETETDMDKNVCHYSLIKFSNLISICVYSNQCLNEWHRMLLGPLCYITSLLKSDFFIFFWEAFWNLSHYSLVIFSNLIFICIYFNKYRTQTVFTTFMVLFVIYGAWQQKFTGKAAWTSS